MLTDIKIHTNHKTILYKNLLFFLFFFKQTLNQVTKLKPFTATKNRQCKYFKDTVKHKTLKTVLNINSRLMNKRYESNKLLNYVVCKTIHRSFKTGIFLKKSTNLWFALFLTSSIQIAPFQNAFIDIYALGKAHMRSSPSF